MTSEQILAEIREANLGYLMLAQSLIRGDREQAMERLGIGDETATLIGSLSASQIVKMATGNTLLCQMRIGEDLVWDLITSHKRPAANEAAVHAPAGRRQEAA